MCYSAATDFRMKIKVTVADSLTSLATFPFRFDPRFMNLVPAKWRLRRAIKQTMISTQPAPANTQDWPTYPWIRVTNQPKPVFKRLSFGLRSGGHKDQFHTNRSLTSNCCSWILLKIGRVASSVTEYWFKMNRFYFYFYYYYYYYYYYYDYYYLLQIKIPN